MAAPQAESALRGDIQALRALAVSAVILFHLWPHRLTGGYVGVDVFFAISGYLITSHLLAEVDRTGTLRPARFWARRAKRLVPASTLALLSIAVVVLTSVPRRLWSQFFQEVMASSVQVENWLLAHNATDYLASSDAASPSQHFWTLGVEEQFYVALPLLLLLSVGIARVLRVRLVRRVAIPLVVLVLIASFAYSVYLTRTNGPVAYFSTLTRAWEFGGGVLLAFGRPSAKTHRVLPWVGIAAIVLACVWFTGRTAFPGYAAALPVLGTSVTIATGVGSALDRLGAWGPVALLGRVSYSAYLWHWPMIVLLPFLTLHPLTTLDKLGILVATVVVAWVSTRFVEDPIRFSPRLLGGSRRPRTVGLAALAAVASVLSVSATASHAEMVRTKQVKQRVQQILASPPRCLGAAAIDPALAPCKNPALADTLIPEPASAMKDDANRQECWNLAPSGAPHLCHLGPPAGFTKRFLALGDSHSNNLIDVYEDLARQHNWQIDVTGYGGCYFTSAEQVQSSQVWTDRCRTWKRGARAIATQGGYDGFLVTHSAGDRPVVGPVAQRKELTIKGLVEAWGWLPDKPIVALRDNPHMRGDIVACVEAHGGSDDRRVCGRSRAKALGAPDGQREAALQVPRATVIDMSEFYCDATYCPAVIGHVLVYRDISHVTRTYLRTLEPYLEPRLAAALAAA